MLNITSTGRDVIDILSDIIALHDKNVVVGWRLMIVVKEARINFGGN